MNTDNTSLTTGIVLGSTRRFVQLSSFNKENYLGTLATRKLEAVVGDIVDFRLIQSTEEEQLAEITNIHERKNLLKRSYERKTKQLASNLDHLFIVVAPPPLFNSQCLDRMLIAAHEQGIDTSIIANKYDLEEFSELESIINYYKEKLNLKIFNTSAVSSKGIDDLVKFIDSSGENVFAFSGVSGVGKSSILNLLFPGQEIKTGDVSEKTGQGRQTTSSSCGYLLWNARKNNEKIPQMIIDLPGIQKYGLSHLDIQDISKFMLDILELSENCKFYNCTHRDEPDCEVKNALDQGTLPKSRYHSYLDVFKEIERANSYKKYKS